MTNEALTKRIQKLLALGQSSNQHEAEAAMAKAQALLTEHNLTMADLGSDEEYVEKSTGIGSIKYTFKTRNIVWLIQDHFSVTVLIMKGKPESRIALFGTSENVESAIFAFNFLQEAFERIWAKEYTARCEGRMTTKQIATERNSFMCGLRDGLDHKLTEEKRKAAEEHYNNDMEKANTAIIALDDKSLITDFMKKKYTNTHKVAGPKVNTSSSTAFTRGYQQGSKINIAKAIAS